MSHLDGYCIDRYEASLEVRDPSDKFVAHSPFARPQQGQVYRAVSRPGVAPQAYINRLEAAQACEVAGKQLCTVTEWYAACRGSKKTTYPYGPHKLSNTCNTNKPHLLSRLFGTNPHAWKYEHFNNPLLNQQPGFLAKTGEYEKCQSDYGVYDMVGNLHEWVADSVSRSLVHKLPLRPGIRKAVPSNTGNAIFMGGFFSTSSEHGYGCGFVTIGHEKEYHDYSTGFRCCKPEQ